MLKHEHIALRFLPQKSFERVAPLYITPQPDVITRVFMLFKGLASDEIGGEWPLAVEKAKEDVRIWTDVVGVDVDRVNNKVLFRVLEWGGMEIGK